MQPWQIHTMMPESFSIPDGKLDWFPSFLPSDVADRYFHELIDHAPWKHEAREHVRPAHRRASPHGMVR